MGFDFTPRATHRVAEKTMAEHEANADGGYRSRADAEKDRRRLATDDNHWCCFCFRDKKDLDRFDRLFSLGGRSFVSGIEFREAAKPYRHDGMRRGFSPKRRPHPARMDPIKAVSYTGDLEADSLAEADVIHDAFMSVSPHGSQDSLESGFWVCVAFRDSDDLDSFLTEWALWGYGDRYLDGSRWLSAIS